MRCVNWNKSCSCKMYSYVGTKVVLWQRKPLKERVAVHDSDSRQATFSSIVSRSNAGGFLLEAIVILCKQLVNKIVQKWCNIVQGKVTQCLPVGLSMKKGWSVVKISSTGSVTVKKDDHGRRSCWFRRPERSRPADISMLTWMLTKFYWSGLGSCFRAFFNYFIANFFFTYCSGALSFFHS